MIPIVRFALDLHAIAIVMRAEVFGLRSSTLSPPVNRDV